MATSSAKALIAALHDPETAMPHKDWSEIVRALLQIGLVPHDVEAQRGPQEAEMPVHGWRTLLSELLTLLSTGLSEFAHNQIVALVDYLRSSQPAR